LSYVFGAESDVMDMVASTGVPASDSFLVVSESTFGPGLEEDGIMN
jgi:hypothetical protein